MVCALDSGSSGPRSILGRVYSHSASLHPGVQMGTGEFNSGAYPVMD